ncbi:calcium/sodium antiporter [Haloferacaceae archaeon DSL9]
MWSPGLSAVLLVIAIAGLWFGSHVFVEAATSIAERLGVSELVIGLTVVAMGTSSPEIVVSANAALAGRPDVALGNIIGSNVFNLAAILGSVALVGAVPISRAVIRRDGPVLLGTTLLLFAFVWSRVVTRIEGVVLLCLLAGYLFVLYRSRRTHEEQRKEPIHHQVESPSARFGGDRIANRRLPIPPWLRQGAALVGGLGIVLGSGYVLVESATILARAAGVSEWAIGATIVAAGTSTPELAVSLVAISRGRLGVSLGNVVGSNAFNVLGVLGIAAVLAGPIRVSAAAVTGTLWLTVLVFVTVTVLWTGRTLTRWEGALLVATELFRWILNLTGVLR